MRDIFEEIFANQALDPTEAARRNMRPNLRARFYRKATAGEGEQGFPVLLDGRPVRTPAGKLLAAPVRTLAEALAAGHITVDEAWAAAHADEDWNMECWGRDELALQRRAYRFAEMAAAAKVLSLLR